MEWVETTGRTLEEAKDLALDRLGVDEQDAEFEVLEEPKTGLFGRVRGGARVRARVRPTKPRPKLERRDRRRRKGRDGDRQDDRGATTGAPTGDGEGSPGAADTGDRAGRRPDAAAGEGRRSGGGRRSRGGQSRPGERAGAGARGSQKSGAGDPPATPRPAEEAEMSERMTVEDQASEVAAFLEGLADAFGVDGQTTQSTLDDGLIEIQLQGDDLGLLIGPRGATITAIYELAKTVVQHRSDGDREGRFRIDIGGYRERRREALERFAREQADAARQQGTELALEPMGAADRKVVHDTINDIDGVTTRSEGEEPRRRVVIVPNGD